MMCNFTKRSYKLFGICLLLFCISCRGPIKSREVLLDYINDPAHGLKQIREINTIKAVLTYKPWQLLTPSMRQLKTSTPVSGGFNYNNKLFFVLSLSADQKELLRQLEYGQYSEMVQLMSFRMPDYIKVKTDLGKEYIPENCILQQTYGLANSNSLLIIFKNNELLSSKQLHIKIREFGLNIGNMNFVFDSDNIKNIPEIAF
jgi:hypothetical protein